MQQMIKAAIGEKRYVTIQNRHSLPDLRNKKILYAVELDEAGMNIPLFQIISSLYQRGHDALEGASGALLIHSKGALFTKSMAANIIFLTNQLGCRFMGHPLVEATKDLQNFLTWQNIHAIPLADICMKLSKNLGDRLMAEQPLSISNPKILALHSSSKSTSNTLMLWDMVKKNLGAFQVEELHVANGTVLDCIGCTYHTCMHYGLQHGCFYGGFMTKEVNPGVEACDALVWICPNYNDSISSNLMAVINRLTALYRRIKFYDKSVFAIVVSGNSGSDSVAKQLIDALNINKGFRLPPYFVLMATANDPSRILKVEGIEDRARSYSENMIKEIKA